MRQLTAPFQDGGRNHVGIEEHGPRGIVISGDDAVDAVRVAVGVGHSHDRESELLRFLDRKVFLVGIQHEQHGGQRAHRLHSAQGLLQLHALPLNLKGFLLDDSFVAEVFARHVLVLLQAVDGLTHGAEVGQQPTQPAVVHERTVATFGLLPDHAADLGLGAHKQHRLALSRGLLHKVVGVLQLAQGLTQVNDVDAALGAVDVRGHRGVPTFGLVPKVSASFKELFHRQNSHEISCEMALVNPWNAGSGSGKCESSPQALTIWFHRFELLLRRAHFTQVNGVF